MIKVELHVKIQQTYRSGFSFIELILVISISSILYLACLNWYSVIEYKSNRLLKQLQLQQELQRVMLFIQKDLRRAGTKAFKASITQDNFHLFLLPSIFSAVNIGSVAGEREQSCILFLYDLDSNGCIGKTNSAACAQDQLNLTNDIQRELFGYRLKKGALETRMLYKTDVIQNCSALNCQQYLHSDSCNKGAWFALLDKSEYEIIDLRFNWLVEGAGLEVVLAARLKKFPQLSYTTSAVVMLFNNRAAK